jgi:hypothetical protein
MNRPWLRSGWLLYRLTEDNKPRNSHMVTVQMSNGSMADNQREELAEKLETLLNIKVPAMENALKLAREWIIEAKRQGVSLPDDNTMYAIRTALADIPEV